ncbi:MAG: cytochrome c3 family protein [Gemmatimonadetes bacterium]|nr:cytochrome c3 family protein [Gemmatimonadota bacterium]
MTRHWLFVGLSCAAALVTLAFIQVEQDAEHEEEEAAESVQPIAFPHDQHSGSEPGQNRMDCQYCHFSAERSVDAGIPSVASCWGCHQAIPGTDARAEVAKIGEYVRSGEPIPWVRIYKVSDHVRFPHMRHVNAGLTCQECHGEVQETGVIEEPSPVWGGDNMGWCVSCHRKPDENGEQQASTDCAVCHY